MATSDPGARLLLAYMLVRRRVIDLSRVRWRDGSPAQAGRSRVRHHSHVGSPLPSSRTLLSLVPSLLRYGSKTPSVLSSHRERPAGTGPVPSARRWVFRPLPICTNLGIDA